MKQDNFYRVLGIFILAFFLLMMMLAVTGCSPAKIGAKAIDNYKSSSAFPGDCATAFPIKLTPGKTDTVTITNTVIDCDSLQASYDAYWASINSQQFNGMRTLADSIAAMQARGIPPPSMKMSCPPSLVINKTDTVESTAKIEALERRLNEVKLKYEQIIKDQQNELLKTYKKLKNRNKQNAFGWGLASLLGIYVFRNQLNGLFGNLFGLLAGLLKRRK